jgi:hypothetical protein
LFAKPVVPVPSEVSKLTGTVIEVLGTIVGVPVTSHF